MKRVEKRGELALRAAVERGRRQASFLVAFGHVVTIPIEDVEEFLAA